MVGLGIRLLVRRVCRPPAVRIERVVKGKLAICFVGDDEAPYYVEVDEGDDEESIKRKAVALYRLKRKFPMLS
jgi:hypothetical protein